MPRLIGQRRLSVRALGRLEGERPRGNTEAPLDRYTQLQTVIDR